MVLLDPLGPDHRFRWRHQHRGAVLIGYQDHPGAEPLHQRGVVSLADFDAAVVDFLEYKGLIFFQPLNPYRHGEVPFAT
ncbi:hypothetical protein D3C85_1834780 [compost metagenome]